MRLVWIVAMAVILMVSATGFKSAESLFAPDADLWNKWLRSDETNPARIDFESWDAFLDRYVVEVETGANLVRYAEVSGEDRAELDAFVEMMTSLPISNYRREEQLVYWINLYNALTVQLVLHHYPVESIREIDISPGFFSDGPWDKKLIRIEGEDLSLNDIEHRILRPIWRDSRIHYAVNCASLGCPSLQPFAYSGDQIDEMLDNAARGYVNDPRGVTINENRVTVSKIYDWFGEDFGGSVDGIITHLTAYAEEDLAEKLRQIGTIHDAAYDWSLNDSRSIQ